jgi:hypothetical protein
VQQFRDSIVFDFSPMKLSAIEAVNREIVSLAWHFYDQWRNWPVLIFVMLLLLLFTRRMAKDVSKGKSEHP